MKLLRESTPVQSGHLSCSILKDSKVDTRGCALSGERTGIETLTLVVSPCTKVHSQASVLASERMVYIAEVGSSSNNLQDYNYVVNNLRCYLHAVSVSMPRLLTVVDVERSFRQYQSRHHECTLRRRMRAA